MIIGITGPLEAGKGPIVEILKERGFTHYSAREFIVEEVRRRGLPENRDSMTLVANGLRAQHGAGYIIQKLYKKAREAGGKAVIESVRAVGEIEPLKKEGSMLLAVDADPKLRYERIVKRGSSTDHVSYEKFLADEAREDNNTDPTKGNLSACIALADYIIQNNGSVEDLRAQVGEILGKIGV